ncbi:MAG TPA: hypothetical protein VLX91_15215 [Candidatus Acidoferrales bacterium]|nr:hypothetical protein [Candidatus Acidoferrales bacterium]
MKKWKCLFLILVTSVSGTFQVFAQSYYYNNSSEELPVWRLNLQSGTKSLFYSDSINPYSNVLWDPTQQWIFIERDNSYIPHIAADHYYISTTVVNANTPSITHVFPDQYPHPPGTSPNSFFISRIESPLGAYDGIVYNSVKNVFYVTWFLPAPDSLKWWGDLSSYQRTAAYDASTFTFLDTLPVPPGWITGLSSVSDDGSYLYLEKWGYGKVDAIGKYSLLTKQLTINRSLSDLKVPDVYTVEDSKKGNFLLCLLYPQPQMEDKEFGVYNVDKDTMYSLIPFPLQTHEYLSGDAKVVMIEETPLVTEQRPWGTDYVYQHTGCISIFDDISGTLLQKLKLPQDGKVLVFDNYPNMLYYYYEKKQRSINIDLSKLPTIGTINAQNVLVGSGAFTLSVTGKNFTPTSKVQLNGTNRATTFIADTLLQATIRAEDVDTATTAYIAVRDSIAPSSHSTTDSLALNIISVPQQSLQPILDCVTQTNDTTYTAWFGYGNDDTTSIFVPVGPQNKFSPTPNDRNQTITFEPGRKDKVFSVIFNGKNLTWKLNGSEVVASKKSPRCN